jgi:hypothetical protein
MHSWLTDLHRLAGLVMIVAGGTNEKVVVRNFAVDARVGLSRERKTSFKSH